MNTETEKDLRIYIASPEETIIEPVKLQYWKDLALIYVKLIGNKPNDEFFQQMVNDLAQRFAEIGVVRPIIIYGGDEFEISVYLVGEHVPEVPGQMELEFS